MSSSSCIIYPKPFEPLDKRTLPNEIGFTMTEIAALRNGWRLINRRFAYHSKRIFMEFFQEHETLLERFRDRQGKFDMAHLHGHPQQILSIYGRLIEKGVDDMTYMNVMMAELSLRHRRYGVLYGDIKLLTNHISLYILQYLEKIISPTFIIAMKKLTNLINGHHRDPETLGNSSCDSIYNL